jgi:hypothetical protein
MSLISINKKICFSEGPDIANFTINVNTDFATVKENLSIFSKRNTFFDNIGECSIYPGINSSFGQNDILNSSFYKIDSFRNDLYEVSRVLLFIKESNGFQETQLQNNSELIITDYLNNVIRFIFKTDSNVFDGSTDEFGNVIIGIQNISGNQYLQRINLAIKNYLKVNQGLNFSIDIDNYNNELLLLKQKKPGILGSIYVVAPEGIVIAENISGKFSNENYENKLEYIPYKEDVVINKVIKDNPRIFKKTLGINNLDYEEEIYFDDSLTKFNNDFYFESPDRMKWNFTFNSKAINSLSSTISPIETMNILEGNITTEQSLLGIKGDLICNGKDSRGRDNIQTNKERLMPNESYVFNTTSSSKNEYEIEPFNDEGYDELVAIRSEPYEVNYEFQKVEINGRFINKLVALQNNQTRNLTILSNNILVYNEDKMDILPFYERNRVTKNYLKTNEEVFLDNEVLSFKHYSYGRDINSEHSILPESIAYYGEIE